tara:strand:- start:83 stop:427 length:345 start_codon:yes stop_codon:yes gene_type:complete
MWKDILKAIDPQYKNIIKQNIFGLLIPLAKQIPSGEYKIMATMNNTQVGESSVDDRVPMIAIQTKDIVKALSPDGIPYQISDFFDIVELFTQGNEVILGSFIKREREDVLRLRK